MMEIGGGAAERKGSCLHRFCKGPERSDLIWAGKGKTLVLKSARSSLWRSPGHAGSARHPQSVGFLFPMSPGKLLPCVLL